MWCGSRRAAAPPPPRPGRLVAVDAPSPAAERVVLLDGDGHAVGTEDKATVHHGATPLHLAFSCYVFSGDRVLLTRRAAAKRAFAGVWTNSLCGHPAPGEELGDAVRRRAGQELGLVLADLRLVLPRFRYRAVADGVVEHEMCPVLTATTADVPAPDPDEVADLRWVDWASFVARVRDGAAVSPWCAEQVVALAALGDGPAAWPAADPAELPPAARQDVGAPR